MTRPRAKPYTAIGIRRVGCSFYGCPRKGFAQWDVCADGNKKRVFCFRHDIALNRLVLNWIGDPDRREKLKRYEASVKERAGVA